MSSRLKPSARLAELIYLGPLENGMTLVNTKYDLCHKPLIELQKLQTSKESSNKPKNALLETPDDCLYFVYPAKECSVSIPIFTFFR